MTKKTNAPPKRPRWLLKAALRAQIAYDAIHRFLARVTGRLGKPMAAEIYYVVRHRAGVSVRGRVLLARTWPHPHRDDPGSVNLYHMIRRWATPERPYSLVRCSAGGAVIEMRANREGYFDLEIPASEAPEDSLLIEMPESSVSPPVRLPIEVLEGNPSCLIISDIDDTVLLTHAGRFLSMIATTMLGNALTRQIFTGVPTLLHALRQGADPGVSRLNPIAYVTSSPYNLHNLLTLVFEENDVPLGPCFMTDWGLDENKWLWRSHRDHKHEAIATILHWYPNTPTLLLGDSTQLDTSIYIEAAQEYPERIAMIMIHVVSSDKRMTALHEEAKRLEDSKIPLHFYKNSTEAANILADAGWISADQARSVREICERENQI